MRARIVAKSSAARGQLTPPPFPWRNSGHNILGQAGGEEVTRVRVGDWIASCFHARWYGGTIKSDYLTDRLGANLDGMLAECAVLKEEALVHVPSHLSFEEAATLPCAAVTTRVAVTRDRRVTAGDTVLTRAPEAYRCLPCNSPGSWATAALARRPYVPLRPLALRNGDFCRRSDLW